MGHVYFQVLNFFLLAGLFLYYIFKLGDCFLLNCISRQAMANEPQGFHKSTVTSWHFPPPDDT